MDKDGKNGDLVDDSLLEGEDGLDLDLGDDGLAEGAADGKDLEGKDKKLEDADDGIEVVIEGQETLDDVEREGAEGAERKGADSDAEGDDVVADGKTDYGRKVRARIDREVRIARDATARAVSANQRALAAEAKSRAVQKDALEVTENALKGLIETTKNALVKAKEDGKVPEEVDLQSRLATLNTRVDSIARAKENLAAEEEAAKRGAAAQDGPNHLAEEWKANNPWFGHARFAEQTGIIRAIDTRMKNVEGYDPKDPKYFEELDRRVRRRIPEVVRYIKGAQRQHPQPRQEQRRDAAAPVQRQASRDSQEGRPRPGKIVLKAADLANMERFGLDTKDPAVLKEYALNKVKEKTSA